MKKLFSYALAVAMLLSISIQSVSAADFADAAEIKYVAAVASAAEKGLFAGSEVGGKLYFNPKDTVTRAQMATVMVKLLKGSDFDANPYKGAANKFPDTADFQGGWAEGYISACAQLGVVSGYGDGRFGPGDKVTAAQAVTMIINALKVDAGQGEWPTTVMNKAEEMKLFGVIEPKPTANDPMSREQLAVIVLEGVKYLEQGEADADSGSSTPSSGSSSGGSSRPSSGGSSGGSSKPSGTVVKPSGGTTKPTVPQEPETPVTPETPETPVVPETPETPEQGGQSGPDLGLGENDTPVTPVQPEQGGQSGSDLGLGENDTPVTPVQPGSGSGSESELPDPGPNATPWG